MVTFEEILNNTGVTNAPKILAEGEGMTYEMGPQKMLVKLMSGETGGAMVVCETRIDEPGFGPPYHVHTLEDEIFMVQEGELILTVDGTEHTVGAGGMAYAPRNVPHTFRSGPRGVRFTALITGSNFERFHVRYAEAMMAGDMDRATRVAAEHGISFVA